MVMMDMCNTFPYFLVKNVKEEVPSIIVPSEDGSYYKGIILHKNINTKLLR